jgi:hypothetical protein
MEDVAHGDYMIEPRAWRLVEGRYAASGVVYREYGDTTRTQPFEVAGAFMTEDDALRAAVEHGQALIDGRQPGLAI